MQQLAFDFPYPEMDFPEFLELKYKVQRAERDFRSEVAVPKWITDLKAQFRELCGIRGHQPGRPWDNGIGCVFIECSRCGTRIETKYY